MAEEIQSNIRVNIDTADALAGLKLLQREISAFHTQMSKAGAASAATSAQMGANLINTINQTGKFAASLTTVKTSAQAFTTALEKNQMTMGQYFRYAAGASKSFGKMFATEFATINNVAIERVKDLQTQYIKMGQAANGAVSAIKVRPLTLDMENLGTKTMIAAQRQQLLNQMLDLGSTKLLNFGKNMQWAGRQLMVGFTVPLTMFATSAMNSYKQIEQERVQLTRVYGTFETTAAEANKAADSVQKLATQYTAYGLAVKDTMALGATVAAAGATGKDLTDQVAASSKLAVLGRISQDEAFKSIMVLKNAFHLSGKALNDTIGLMNATQNQTVNSVQDITEATIKAGPVVQALGGNMSDLLFFTTAMREGGISASQGANALKSALASMINPTKKASDALATMGIDLNGIVQKDKGNLRATVMDFGAALDKLDPLKRAQALETLFGKFQFARVSALFNNINRAGSQAQAVAGLGNASSEQLQKLMDREMKKVSDSPLYKFQKQLAEFQAAMAPIGEQFMKFLTPIMKFFTDLAKSFDKLPDGMKTAIVAISVILGGIAPLLLMLVGLISNGAANMMKFLVTIKKFFNGLTSGSKTLGEQVKYMNQQEIDAAAEAASLDQVHQKLVQTFTVEREAVDLLAAAYERAAMAARAFGPMPSVAKATAAEASVVAGYNAASRNAIHGIQKYAGGGIVSGPGTGTSDSVPAMLSAGEAVIPAASVKKNPGLVSGLIAGDVPGYAAGYMPYVSTYKSEAKIAYEKAQAEKAEQLRLKREAEGKPLNGKPSGLFFNTDLVSKLGLDENSPILKKVAEAQFLEKVFIANNTGSWSEFRSSAAYLPMKYAGLKENRYIMVLKNSFKELMKKFRLATFNAMGQYVKYYADGGIINGPGTGTSDSVPAMLSNGEAVIPADSVKKNPDMVGALISGNVQKFSEGGIAGTKPYHGVQVGATDAWQLGHLEEELSLPFEDFIKHIKSMLEKGVYSVEEAESAITKAQTKFEKNVESFRTGAKGGTPMSLEDATAKAKAQKYSLYSDFVAAQPRQVNNLSADATRSGSFFKQQFASAKSDPGSMFENFGERLRRAGMSLEEIRPILEKAGTSFLEGIDQFAEDAQISKARIDQMQLEAIQTAVGGTPAATELANLQRRTNIGVPEPTSNSGKSRSSFTKTRVSYDKIPEGTVFPNSPTRTTGNDVRLKSTPEQDRQLANEVKRAQALGGEFEQAANELVRSISSGTTTIEEALKQVLQIASPSKKMAKIGEDAGEGLVVGVSQGLAPVTATIEEKMAVLSAAGGRWATSANIAEATMERYGRNEESISIATQMINSEFEKYLASADAVAAATKEVVAETETMATAIVASFGENVVAEAEVVMPSAASTVVTDMVKAIEAELPQIAAAAEMVAGSIIKPVQEAAVQQKTFGFSQGTMQYAQENINKMLRPFLSPQGVINMEKLNAEYLQNVKIINDNVLANSANKIAIREATQMLEFANAPMNMYYDMLEKLNGAYEKAKIIGTDLAAKATVLYQEAGTQALILADKVETGLTKMSARASEISTAIVEGMAKAGVATKNAMATVLLGKEQPMIGPMREGEERPTTRRGGLLKPYIGPKGTSAGSQDSKISKTMGSLGKVSNAAMMASMALSMLPGPLQGLSQTIMMATMVFSALEALMGIFNIEVIASDVALGGLALVVGGMEIALLPLIAGIALVAAGIVGLVALFSWMADNAKKDEAKKAAALQKSADAVVGFGNALTVSQGQLDNFNTTFSANVGGSAASESNITQTGGVGVIKGRTSDERQQIVKLSKDREFLGANSNLLAQLKSASAAGGNLLINTFAQTMKAQGAAQDDINNYVEALKAAAGRTDLKLDFKTMNIGSKEGMAATAKQITDAANRFKSLVTKYGLDTINEGARVSQNAASVQGLTGAKFMAQIKKIGYGEDVADQRNAYKDSIINQLKGNTDFQQYVKTYSQALASSDTSGKTKADTLDQQIAIFKSSAKGKDNDENNPFYKMINAVAKSSNTAQKGFTDSGKMSVADLQMLHTQAQLVGEDITNMGTAMKNGQMTGANFEKQMGLIGKTVASLGESGGKTYMDSIVNSMKDLDPKVKTAITSLKNMKDEMLLIKAASLGINVDQATIDAIIKGEAAQAALNDPSKTKNMSYSQAVGLSAQAQAGADATQSIADAIAAVEKAAEKAKSPLDKLNEAYQKQSDLMNAESTLLGKVQDKIQAAYKKRIDALTTISKINDQIAQSQKDQLSLATALSQGDIARAAEAAQNMRANNAKNAIDQQQEALQRQSDAAVAAATITYKGKKLNAAQIKAAQEKADIANLLANNKGLGYSLGGIVGYATGGMVAPQYFARGGKPMGTDIIPAMLTPGEFVMKKSAVDRIGAHHLSALNNGMMIHSEHGGDGSVYNYSVNVNVATGANPEEIASTVIKKVKQLNSQNIRGNAYGA